ncbi:hypothetical protein Tco_0730124 [Tanacetum coccineum]|uniref:Uncharacterized protein n=1 Tax=Tanacetum coccineum TaxID=301880 RepID=A0ABQ4YUC0_9ASTR
MSDCQKDALALKETNLSFRLEEMMGICGLEVNSKEGKLLGMVKYRTVHRKDNMYSVDLKNVVPQGGLTYLFAKATPDESNL